ncbi:IclR family transcriptional regulator [Amycolatopsis sp. YIM 10]|uniref:IclR family transcriptional regulator n=1 Tax=Amycolatopsis sp. YIM 10 TaxID=2653857 RepID=UPI001290202E|nr:helix-turn-helix domain-containing protein [Amycolatopsis sp. YIM 10]QFU92520.1 Transcriptional regulator KdgR [Amycolatopsis sp. YIM 10]
MTTGSPDTPIAMIDRVASLLEAFHGDHRLTLAQIYRRVRLPRSSVHRILQRLVELGWVERQENLYSLGIKMFELGVQAVRRDGVHQVALPRMHALHRSTGLTVYLSALASPDVLHLERVGGWPAKGKDWEVGARQSAVRSAPGLALLARLDESDWPELVFPTRPSAGIRNRVQLRRELDRVGDRSGVAVDARGCAADTLVVAASIGPGTGDLRVALSLCGPADTTPVEKAVNAVRMAATEIWYEASGVTPLLPRRTPPRFAASPPRAIAPG